MKITKGRLKEIIKEELYRDTVSEDEEYYDTAPEEDEEDEEHCDIDNLSDAQKHALESIERILDPLGQEADELYCILNQRRYL